MKIGDRVRTKDSVRPKRFAGQEAEVRDVHRLAHEVGVAFRPSQLTTWFDYDEVEVVPGDHKRTDP